MIEALACGTPVIAWPHGSVPEIIEHGRTGFVVETLEDAVAAVKNVGRINRAQCRQVFEERFDAQQMAAQYEAVYQNLVSGVVPRPAPAYAGSQAANGAVRG